MIRKTTSIMLSVLSLLVVWLWPIYSYGQPLPFVVAFSISFIYVLSVIGCRYRLLNWLANTVVIPFTNLSLQNRTQSTNAVQPANVSTPVANLQSYSASSVVKCSDTAGSVSLMQQTGQELVHTGESASIETMRISTDTVSFAPTEPQSKSVPQLTESKTDQSQSSTSAKSNSTSRFVFVCCLATLLYLFPVAVLLELKDTAKRTETQVETLVGIELKLSKDTIRQLAIGLNQ
jgi:hypothetical protein